MRESNRFFTAPLIVVLLMLSFLPIIPVSADETPTTIDMFEGGSVSLDVTLDGNSSNLSSSILVPRNVTFIASSFVIEVNSANPSPGQVFVDVANDGTNEWEFNETGFGNLGHQNVFYTGLEYATVSTNSNTATTPGILLPPDSSLQSSKLNASFSPDVGGGFFQIGEYKQAIESDIDGDSMPEPMFLLEPSGNNSSSFMYIDWNSTGQMSPSQTIHTCNNASSISAGDINADGNQDVVVFSTTNNLACVHIANNTGFEPVRNITISSGLIAGDLGDFDGDGSDDVIAIHTSGEVSFQGWNNASNTLNVSVSETVMENGSFGIPANLANMHVGDFFNNGTVGILVGDFTGHWTLWFYMNSVVAGPIYTFDGITQNSMVSDLDSDGDLEIVGQNDIGYSLQINNGTQWNTTTVMGGFNIANSSISDFNGDGILEIMTPLVGISDGSSTTVEGNITYRTINSTTIGSQSLQILEPWSMPSDIITMDMNGDGTVEQIIAAGESTKGVFIGGWYEISLDADGDGTDEMMAFGYSGDSTNGLDSLVMTDMFNGIMDDLNPVLLGSTKIEYDYGIDMVNNSFSITSTGNGTFNLTDLGIAYDASFLIDTNPHPTGNLTNVLNLEMTPGVGNFSITISVNSTDSGVVKLKNLAAIHIPGAPNSVNPPTPYMWTSILSHDIVQLEWIDPAESGNFADKFELFRAEAIDGISLDDPYQEPVINVTVDQNVTVGATYWYQVRSIHQFGQTSNLSNLLEVTIPYPAPPAAIENLTMNDVDQDMGGTINLSWDEPNASIDYYNIYIENTNFSNVSNLTPYMTIGYGNNTTIATGLIDGIAHYAAIVAVDMYGNYTMEVNAVGPEFPRIDVPSTVEISLSVGEEIQIGKPFDLNVTVTVDGVPSIPTGQVTITMVTQQQSNLISTNWDDISLDDFNDIGAFASDLYGDVTFYANYSGYEGNQTNRPISSTSSNVTSVITVGAELSASSQYFVLDSDGESVIRIDVTATTQSQQSLLNSLTLSYTITNDTTNNTTSGDGTIGNGFVMFFIDFDEGGNLSVFFSQPSWVNAGDDLLITIHPFGTEISQNNTDNDTVEQPWAPESMDLITVDCGVVEIDADTSQDVDCIFNNPNNFTVDISLEADGWSQWPQYILFEPEAGQSEFNLSSGESKTVTIVTSIQDGFADSLLSSGNIEIDFWQGPTDYTTVGDLQRTVEVLWTLKIEEQDNNEQGNNQTNPSQSTKDKTEGSDNTLIYIGAAGGVAVIALIVIVIIRVRNSDIEDWTEEDLEFEQDLPKRERVNKPLPVGVALDEIEDRTIDDEAPERPDVISDFEDLDDYEEDYEGGYEEEYDEEYEEESYTEEDTGISVDEHGTEWYEDEVGVWWYREEGQEDWSEFVE